MLAIVNPVGIEAMILREYTLDQYPKAFDC